MPRLFLFDPNRQSKSLVPKLLKGAGLGLGVAAIAGAAGAGWRGWNFIQSDLAPLVQKELQGQINRPIQIGDLQSLGWGTVTFGRSEIPAYSKQVGEKTVWDRDRASVESVKATFNPIKLLLTRTLDVNVSLNRPRIFLDETPDHHWVSFTPGEGGGEGLIKTNLQSIKLNNGTVQLSPYRTAQRTLTNLNGELRINANQQRIDLKGSTNVDSGGTVALKGRLLTQTQNLKLETKSQNLNIAPLVKILPTTLPFDVNGGKLSGDVNLDFRPNQPLQISSNITSKKLDVYIPSQDVKVKAEQFKGKIQLFVQPGTPVELKGEGQIRNATGSVPEDLILSTGRSRRQVAQNINGKVKFLGQKQRFWSDLTATLPEGGNLKVTGVTSFLEEKSNLNIRAQNIPAPLLDEAFDIPINIRSGQVNGNITLNLNKGDRPSVQGIARLKQIEAQIIGLPQAFKNTNGYLRLKGLTTTLENLTADYGNIPIIGNGSIDPDRGYDLRGRSKIIEVNRGLKTLGVEELPFPVAGSVIAEDVTVTGVIDNPILQGRIRSATALSLDKVPVQQASAGFRLEKPLLKISQIQASPTSGGKINGQAQYSLLDNEPWRATFDATQIPGNAFASIYGADPGFDLGNVASQIKLEVLGDRYQLDADLQAPDGEFPASGSLRATPAGIDLNAIQAEIPGGQLLASGTIIDGQVSLDTKIPGVKLASYSEELRGQLTGELNIQSPLAGFSSATAIAQGQIKLTEGISLIEDPITATVRWNGKNIEIQKATAPDFFAQGTMGAILQGDNAPQLTTLNLAVQKQNYALASLPFELPANSKLSGSANLTGTLFGQVYAPKLNGDLEIQNLIVNDLPFEPQLSGSLNYDTAKGVQLKTRGQQNQVNLALNANQEPVSFMVKNQAALATGQTVAPNQLAVKVDQVPLTALNWDLVNDYGYGRVSGTASGDFRVALPAYDVQGPLTITEPAIGPFKGDRFAGQFQIQNGVLAIRDSKLTRGENRFLIDAQLIPDLNPKFSGSLTIANAQVEDAIVALETLEFIQPQAGKDPSYGDANSLATVPVGDPNAPLLLQLQRLAEINTLRQQQQDSETALTQIPHWSELTGKFKGRVLFNGTAQTGVNADFSLESDGISLGFIPFEEIEASGSYQNQDLEFKTLSLDANGGNLNFQGKLGRKNKGTLQISKLPLGELSLFLSPTLPIDGFLDAEATLAGSFENPIVEGKVEVSDATINQSEIRAAQAKFNFRQARLDLAGFVDINHPDPIRFEGNIPYQFPFMTVKPESDQLSAKLQVKNEGLSLLNLFTDQVSWIEGQGEIDVAIQGTLSRPSIRGRVAVNNATLEASTLPAPLTTVSGELNFDQERVQVSDVRGVFSEGRLSASGTLPIFDPDIQSNSNSESREAVNVNLDDIVLDLRGLYRGGVDGDLKITGSILSPSVGGSVALNNGQIVLSDATALAGGEADGQAEDPSEDSSNASGEAIFNSASFTPESSDPALQFNDLIVSLADNVRILQPPLLNFTTQGQLTVNGSIDSPRPIGTVSFSKGKVNLFTSIFQLNRQEQNFAAFSPDTGLDPYLNINLITTISEVNSGRDNNLNEFEDPLAGTLGSIESVRVNATIDGRASQLLSNFQQAIELTSNPARSETEILSLLSGGIPEAIQDGNTDLALVNIASSAVLNQVQTFVSDAFGGRAVFRLFPILIPNDTERSVLAFGGEFGYDLNNDLSVSVLQVLTGTDEPTRFNVSYDINDRLRTRGSISIEGEATGLLEYRFRF